MEYILISPAYPVLAIATDGRLVYKSAGGMEVFSSEEEAESAAAIYRREGLPLSLEEFEK